MSEIWLERRGALRYTGKSATGAEVAIATDGSPDAFRPGELLRLALAGCTAATADPGLSRRLGEDFPLTVRVDATKHGEDDRYASFAESVELDLSDLTPEEIERLRTVLLRAVDKACTVGSTVKTGAEVELTVGDPSASEAEARD